MIGREVGKFQALFLNAKWDDAGERWVSVAPGTEGSKCHYFLSNEEGSLDHGVLEPGSVLTGDFLPPSGDPNSTYMWIPQDAPVSAGTPRGWVKLCPGVRKNDYVRFAYGFRHGEKIPFDEDRDQIRLQTIIAARDGNTTVADAKKADSDLAKRSKDVDFVFNKSQCSASTGDPVQPVACGMDAAEESAAKSLGSGLLFKYPNALDSSLAKENE